MHGFKCRVAWRLHSVTDPVRKQELLPRLRETLASLEGVERVIDGKAPSLGMPTPEETRAWVI
jgi:hypothetical protein